MSGDRERDDATPATAGTAELAVPSGTRAPKPWRGDEHRLQVSAAKEAGLAPDDVEVELYTEGFSAGMTLEDPYDGAIVARGRTALREPELLRSLRAPLVYLGVPRDAIKVRISDGRFELRVSKHAADGSRPSLESAKYALQVWIGFGLLGIAAMQFFPSYVAAFVWSAGLLLGAWQLRRGLVTGRAMLSARLAMALAMLAKEEQLVLPPVIDDAEAS
jgi:hypothetical protein